MYDHRENEHQELFHLNIDPTMPVRIHIPSPLGTLPYYVYVRVANEDAGRLGNVGMRLDVGGLREEHLDVAPGEGAPKKAAFAAKESGYAWRCLGVANVSRGDGTLKFLQWPGDIRNADLLLCTWPRFIESGLADDWIACQVDQLWAPSGVPLGGIGCGRVDICRDGRFRNFSLNNNQDAPVEDPNGLPGAYLAVTRGGETRELASRPVVAGHKACAKLEFEPCFPQAVLRAPAIFAGLDVSVTLSGTLCPQVLRRSSLPGFLVRWEVTNTDAVEQQITCRMGWPNLVGVGGGIARAETHIGYGDGYYHHWDDPTERKEELLDADRYTGARFSGKPTVGHESTAGEHLLGVAYTTGLMASASLLKGRGEVVADFTIPAGGTATVTMAVVADMPHWIDSQSTERGHYWQNHFRTGEEMLETLLGEADGILAEAGALAAHLADSNLPAWLQRRLCNCTYPLVTNSVFYKDGRFSINEGPTEMAGCYGTIDQRLAAHPATQLLFPQLNLTELGEFAAYQTATGSINHDLGGGHLESGPREMTWPDLTCSFIIQTSRHAWSTGDADFADKIYPHAKRALERHAAWALEGKGVAQVGRGLGTSYDSYHYIGTTGYMATLWLAALAIMEKWAAQQGDASLDALTPGWRAAAIARLETDLWNGKYYDAYNSIEGPRRDTCHAGQLAGEVFCRLLTGTDVLSEERLRSCTNAILTLNGSDRFVAPPDEVSPDGGVGADFSWVPYVEGFMLTAVATQDDPRLWPLWQRIIGAVDTDDHPCDTRLMYRPEQGEPSWGAYYMTAPASWLVYDAAIDFFFTAPTGTLRLRATHPGRYPLIHPLFWGMADVTEDGAVTLTITRVFTDKPVSITTLEIPAETAGVTVAGQRFDSQVGQGRYRHYRLPEAVALQAGTTISWQVSIK